ncbi:MAG: sensor histidine kinase [Hymenobacteraceae bacterium]|nr:sensor histidine kinase [Hymenobacteraceae bacterium]
MIIGVLVLMSISLLGVVGLQLYWINDAIKVKQEQFDRSVNEALSKVVAKLETQEAVTVVTDQMASLHKPTDSLYHAEPQQTAPAAQTKKNLNAAATANVPSVTAAPAGPAATVPPHTESSAQAAQPKYRAAQAVATAQRQGSAGDFVFYFSKADSSRIKQVLRNISGTSTTIVPSLTRGAEGYQQIVNAQVDSLTVARLRKGGILQLEQVTDTTHKRFLRINNRPVRISADTLRSMALQLDSLRQHVKFTSVFSPTEIASVDVRNDSVFIVRKGKKDPVLISSGNHAGAITLMGSRTPSPVLNRKDTVPHRIAVSQKVATALTATVSPSTEGAAQAGKATKVPPPKKIKPSDIKKIDIRKDKLNDVVQKMVVEYVVKDVPLQKRMNLQHLPELIKAELQQQGIDLNFGYWVVAGDKDTVAARNLLPLKKQAVTAYKANLFPNDIFDKQDHLGLYFPDSKIYAFKSLGGMLALSALFTLVIIATFGSTIHIIYKQKKLSEMKNDFINNMTHEFKTPIATISLASDAIANPKVYQNPEKVQYYTNIIRQ